MEYLSTKQGVWGRIGVPVSPSFHACSQATWLGRSRPFSFSFSFGRFVIFAGKKKSEGKDGTHLAQRYRKTKVFLGSTSHSSINSWMQLIR